MDNCYAYPALGAADVSRIDQLTSIKVPAEVRDRVRSLKRGQESYAELLDKMAEQYEPEVTRDP